MSAFFEAVGRFFAVAVDVVWGLPLVVLLIGYVPEISTTLLPDSYK